MKRIFYYIIFIIIICLPFITRGEDMPLWASNNTVNRFTISSDNYSNRCGPAENIVCLNCHDGLTEAPMADIRELGENTHGRGMYRLSANEYLSVNNHTFSNRIRPKCTNCHFNPDISKAELRSFNYKTLGDRLCYTCHEDKHPAKRYNTNSNTNYVKKDDPNPNTISEELRREFEAKRARVAEYRLRMKLD